MPRRLVDPDHDAAMPSLVRLWVAVSLLFAAPAVVGADRAQAPRNAASISHRTTAADAGTRWLSRLAPSADPQVLELAVAAMHCAQASGVGGDARRLAVIDYSRPSLVPRLWLFDLAAGKLLYEEVVAHGQGSGENMATRFSNDDGSHQSSLGLFVTADTYTGRNGYSLRMQGLEPGINDAAMARAIVMHGAPYVDPTRGRATGRLGRSWGCPAVRSAVARPMIDLLRGGQFLFSYYPDRAWLTRSALLNCPAARAVQSRMAKRPSAGPATSG